MYEFDRTLEHTNTPELTTSHIKLYHTAILLDLAIYNTPLMKILV